MALKEGAIVHIFAENTVPPKNKFIIILGEFSAKVMYAYVFINSKINTNVHKTPLQQSMQYKILKKDYDFLKYDSYIDLFTIRDVDKKKVDWVVKNRPSSYKCNLKAEHLNECRRLIHVNRIISGSKCKKLGFFNNLSC
ncbi:hypothetical protein ACQ1R0_05785 [Ornithobacterium rhinotracheale]|uniref:hypothetical protein n=1 Tax=Ornithobacterium rhinotracheale TaxID=28251 RepID=UPI004036B721